MKIITQLQALLNDPAIRPVWEAVKEGFRLVLFAGISAGISYLSTAGTGVSPELVVIGTLFLRALDKALHEYGKENDNKALTGGLSRF
jgi:hypothetical protein